MKERLQKVIAEQGYCSRRAAEKLIAEGKVKVNGHPASIGDKADPARDVITVGGERLWFERKRSMFYYMMYKPRGCVTTMSDSHAAKTIADYISDIPARVYPVGRLDKDSEGLLLLTNDGDLANALTHPSTGVFKKYRVTTKPAAKEEQLIELSSGVELSDGRTAPATVELLSEAEDRGVMEVIIREGKNREIRRMCEAVGLEVIRLKRTAEGPLKLGMLRPGQKRELKDEEIAALKRLCKKADN